MEELKQEADKLEKQWHKKKVCEMEEWKEKTQKKIQHWQHHLEHKKEAWYKWTFYNNSNIIMYSGCMIAETKLHSGLYNNYYDVIIIELYVP